MGAHERRRSEFPALWHTVLQRMVLTVDKPIGYVLGDFDFAFTPLREIVASLLYVDVVSVLEIAVRTQMTRNQFDELGDLEHRLAHLAEQHKLVDHGALEALRIRRNGIAHGVVRVDPEELKRAAGLVQAQLQQWGLVGDAPAYEFYAERSGGA